MRLERENVPISRWYEMFYQRDGIMDISQKTPQYISNSIYQNDFHFMFYSTV